jgi:glycolate oxidase FAD binding subunit
LVVARPEDVEGVSAALAAAAELGAAVVPWGSGARMALGYPPGRYDLALSLERLRSVLAYDPADLTISVQAGISHADLARTLADSRQMLPLDAPLPERATLGGTLATATVGLRRAFYGGPRDLVLGLRVVDASGTILKTGGRVVKNVTGYDMSKLYLGSLGTLGIIVEANFKLAPLPPAESGVLSIFPRWTDALAAAEPLAALAVRPSALVAVTVGALPELVSLAPDHAEYVLLAARYPGSTAVLKRALAEAEAVLRSFGSHTILPLQDTSHETFWSALAGYPQTATRRVDEALLRVSALPMECGAVLEMATVLAAEHALVLSWLTDLATGTLWLRVRAQSPATAAPTDEFGGALRALQEMLTHRWRNAVVLDCPPELKAYLPVWGADPAALDLMREVKRRFDPGHRMNPGRFIGGL